MEIYLEVNDLPMVYPGPIRIVSDWHLGHPGCLIQDIEQVRPLLQGVGTLVLNGDSSEELVRKWQPETTRLREGLVELAEEMEVQLLWIAGNHDPSLKTGWVRLADRKVLVTHGDMVFDEVTPWSKEMPERRGLFEKYQQEHPEPRNLNERWKQAQEVSRLLWPSPGANVHPDKVSPIGSFWKVARSPKKVWEITKLWKNLPQSCAKFLERFAPEAEVLVCGHFHRPGADEWRGRVMMNTGAMMPMASSAVIDWNGDILEYRSVQTRGRTFTVGDVTSSWKSGLKGAWSDESR